MNIKSTRKTNVIFSIFFTIVPWILYAIAIKQQNMGLNNFDALFNGPAIIFPAVFIILIFIFGAFSIKTDKNEIHIVEWWLNKHIIRFNDISRASVFIGDKTDNKGAVLLLELNMKSGKINKYIINGMEPKDIMKLKKIFASKNIELDNR